MNGAHGGMNVWSIMHHFSHTKIAQTRAKSALAASVAERGFGWADPWLAAVIHGSEMGQRRQNSLMLQCKCS